MPKFALSNIGFQIKEDKAEVLENDLVVEVTLQVPL